jgi:hypothetical protein
MAKPRARLPRPVVADRLDLRDRPYNPDVTKPPPASFTSLTGGIDFPTTLDQKSTNACTGFALARVIDFLLSRAERAKEHPVSPYMLYSMARRYDELPGWTDDEGSSLRGALKGWYKHGACSSDLWADLLMPPAKPAGEQQGDWWQNAATRPLGAYYRVDTRSVTDMQIALRDVGVIYASAVCHAGWDKGFNRRRKANVSGDSVGTEDAERPEDAVWTIPQQPATALDGGHAFVIFGYDARGFLILNSWGARWGSGGKARLTYDDWLDNAMDCWVAQLGVMTETHQKIANAVTLRQEKHRVSLAADRNLRNQELAPFIIDMENNGALSDRGSFRTSKGDLDALVDIHLAEARKLWGRKDQKVDIAIYAHGGLTGEDTAADTAARWIPALYDAQIFPIFLMWETDLLSTVRNRVADLIDQIQRLPVRVTAGLRDQLQHLLNRRIERTLSKPGSAVWAEMKQNAEAISSRADSGARLLYKAAKKAGLGPDNVRLHLIGHSAGAIVHTHIVDVLAGLGWKFTTVTFLAPAVTRDEFARRVLPRIGSDIGAYYQFHLKGDVESKDPTCRPILGYGRSLLYLVSESFEEGKQTKILGLEKDFGIAGQPRITAFAAPGPKSASSTHGGFDDDELTMRSVIGLIKDSATAVRNVATGRAGARRRMAAAARRTRPAIRRPARRARKH